MKPFDLELAKAGAKVQTRDGSPARIICFDRKNIMFPIIALIKYDDNEDAQYFDNDGKCWQVTNGGLDLVMASTKKEGWINLFKDERKGHTRLPGSGIIHDSQEAALYSVDNDPNYVTTIKIEWEE